MPRKVTATKEPTIQRGIESEVAFYCPKPLTCLGRLPCSSSRISPRTVLLPSGIVARPQEAVVHIQDTAVGLSQGRTMVMTSASEHKTEWR